MDERYSRQILFDGIGASGQLRLQYSKVLIVGCGALGTAQAEMLSRAGVKHIRIADRDFVETTNLQRQTMFTERDAEDRIPKAAACARHISEINSSIEVEPFVIDVNSSNIESLIEECDLVLDGTDNFATRYLINDVCVKKGTNWIYGAAVGSYGVTMTIRPGVTPCLRCIFEESPPAGSAETCDTAGVIMPIIAMIVSVQISETLKLLTGAKDLLHHSLMQFDVWRNEFRRIKLGGRKDDCATCVKREFKVLDAPTAEFAGALCGRDAVQISPNNGTALDLEMLSERLARLGEVKINQYLLRFRTSEFELTLFRDARAIIRGTDDVAFARSVYARYVGT